MNTRVGNTADSSAVINSYFSGSTATPTTITTTLQYTSICCPTAKSSQQIKNMRQICINHQRYRAKKKDTGAIIKVATAKTKMDIYRSSITVLLSLPRKFR
jgi:hypothetical protein